MKISNYISLLVIFLSLSYSATSQNDTLYFRHYAVEQGLSHNNVTSIIQDSLGFMWYGTQSGLNKFDGYGFINFKHDPKNKNSLVSDDINCMSVEKSGIIWIGTKLKGVNRLDPYTGIFTAYMHKGNDHNALSEDLITSIKADTVSGLIWIGTYSKGLDVLDPVHNTFRHYYHTLKDSTSISNNSITCIAESKDGELWVGTNGGGVNVYNTKTGKLSFYRHNSENNRAICSDSVQDIFIDNKLKQVWIATINGLSLINRLTGEIKIFRHANDNPNSLSSNELSSVYQDKAGKIWVGTKGNGLNVYYPETGKFFLYSHETKEQNTLSSNHINSISQGRSGMFWAATNDGGLNAFNPKSLKFRLLSPFPAGKETPAKITSVYESANGLLCIGTDDKNFVIYNPIIERISAINNFSAIGSIYLVVENKNQSLTLCTENGLYQYDLQTGKTVALQLLKSVCCAYYDGTNMIWIGTKEKKLFAYDIRKEQLNSCTQIPTGSDISCILQDHKGKIWMGTYGDGAIAFYPGKGNFISYRNDAKDAHSIGSNYINHICEDTKGTVWLSTWGGGLNTYQPDKNNFNCYSTQDGLPTNSIGKMLIDNNNNLWIGTDNGICRLTFENFKLLQCRIFDLSDGLPVLEFYNGVSIKRKNGEMIFSCEKGLVSFNPDSLKNNPYKPPVIITDFQIFNRSVQPGDSTGILKSSISVTKEIDLTYRQNVFSFEFTAISFINAIKNKYAYKMEGFDDNWIYTDAKKRFATFTNLAPGSYTFTVKASNNDGTWNEKGTSIKINISPPFYKTWWFCSLIAIAFAAAVYALYRYRRIQLLRMEQMRNKISKDLHDDIGSALSSISIYSTVAEKMSEEKFPEVIPVLTSMGDSARTAMDNMSDIVWAINPSNDTFASMIERVQIFANKILGAKNINLHFNIDDALSDTKLTMQERKNLYLIFKEAINNVAKYSEAQNCFVVADVENKKINVQIKDDGCGFEANHKTLGGSGLVNMKQRAKELNSVLNIFSEKPNGTVLTLQFNTK